MSGFYIAKIEDAKRFKLYTLNIRAKTLRFATGGYILISATKKGANGFRPFTPLQLDCLAFARQPDVLTNYHNLLKSGSAKSAVGKETVWKRLKLVCIAA